MLNLGTLGDGVERRLVVDTVEETGYKSRVAKDLENRDKCQCPISHSGTASGGPCRLGETHVDTLSASHYVEGSKSWELNSY